MSPLAFISLGSNQGDSPKIIREAFHRLQLLGRSPLLLSSLWLTTPVDCPLGSPRFVNAVVGLEPREGESPETLLVRLQKMEVEFGRRPKQILNEARPLDLDLLSFGAERRDTPALRLPHPRAHLRKFVLQPLSEIAPDLILPHQTKPVVRLLQELASTESVSRLA